MSVRAKVLASFEESESGIMGEEMILDAVQGENARTVLASLDGLVDEDILDSYQMLDSKFYLVNENVTEKDLRQAVSGSSASEIGEEIIQSSEIFGKNMGVTTRDSALDDLIGRLI